MYAHLHAYIHVQLSLGQVSAVCMAGEVAEGSTSMLGCALTCVRMLLRSCLPMCMGVGIMHACVSRVYVSDEVRNLPGSDTSLDMTCHTELTQGSLGGPISALAVPL